MNDQAQAYWDSLDKANQEESGGGGGGIISNATVSTGYRVFASGVDQDAAWFPADPADGAARKEAKAAAGKLAQEHGCNLEWGLAICTPTEQSFVRGEKATWNTSVMVRFKASWTSAAKEVMLPSLKEHGVFPLPWSGWVRIGFKPDPYAVANDKKDDQGRYEQVPYISEVFKNPREAKKAIAEMPKGDATKADVPPGYTAADWDELRDTIVEALQSQEVAEVAEDYQVDESYIQAIADSVVPV